VVAVGAAGEQPQVGVGCLGQGVAQVVVEGVVDQRQKPGDGAGEGDELGDAAASASVFHRG
jgi:hypothetical protein